MAHQLAGVDVADADDVLGDEMSSRLPVARQLLTVGLGSRTTYPATPDTGGFRILPVDYRVPDVRERLHHDLPIVTGSVKVS